MILGMILRKRNLLWVALLGIFLLAGGPAQAVKPMAPFTVALELTEAPQVGVEVPVLLKVRSLTDAPLVRIRCHLPKGVEMVSGQETWEGALKAGELKPMPFSLLMDRPGLYPIQVSVTFEFPGGATMRKNRVLLIDLEREKGNKPEEKKTLPFIWKGTDGRPYQKHPLRP